MSVPVSENQQNQKWALFAKAISSERSAKLGFDVLFNAERRKNNFSSFTQSYKAGNQSSLTPLIRAVVQPLCLMLAMVISPILASAVVDITNPVVTPPANLTVAASSATGTIATVAPALTSYLTAHDPASWQKSDGWSNGGMFQVGWRADHVSFANGSLVLKLDNQPACTSTSLACSNQAYASGEYKSLSTISHGRLTFRAKPAQGSGVVTGLFTYTGTSGTASHDEIDIEFLGKDTTGVQFNYFVAGVGGHEFWLPLGFDAALAFHNYTIEWLPNAINWYVDGVLKHTVNAGAGVTLPSRPQNIFMNLWASTGVNAWTGLFVYSVPISAEVSQISYKPKATAAFARFLNGATATDNVGVVGDITNNAPVTLPVGTTTVTFTATDAAGNQGTATSTVTVNAYIPPDTTAPVIALTGANPITVAQGSTYLDGGSVVTDNVDTGLIAKLTGKVNTAAVGTYTLTYNATDKSGNKAVAKIRTVQVVASMQWGNTKGSLIKQPILNAGNDLILKLKGGSGNYSLVRVKGPNGYTGTLIANSLGDYLFTAPSTGAFAGNYILSMKDQATKQLLSITVRVPLKIKASRLNILESQTNQTLTIYGGLAADVFKVEVLNVSVVGKPKPDTGINAIAANIANITATTQAAKGNPAVAIVVPSNVVGIVPFKVRVTDLTQTALPAVVSQRMHIVAENTLQLSVTDASSNLPIVGAKVMLRLPPSVVATAQVQTNTNAKGVAAPVLPVGQYDFDVSAKNYVSGVLKITQGKTIAAIALSPITSSVTYRGSIAVTGGYVLTAQAKVIAVDAKGNQQAVVTGKATSFNLTVDQNLFTPVRFIARDVYAMTDVITTFPVAGGSIGTFTLRAKPAPIAEASLQKDKLVSTAAAGRSVTFTANTNVLGSANGVKKILVLAKPTKQSGTAAPQTGSVTIAVNKPVIQVMKDAKGNLLSAPVVYQKLVDVYTGVERRHVAGTKPMVLDASTLDTFSMPALKTVSNITLHLPMNAFQAKTATGVPLVVKDVFTTVSGVVASTPLGKNKAQLTGGEIVVVDMVAFDAAGNVLSTDPGNGNLGKGMEIRIPLDANALMAVGSSAIAASADFASGKLVVYTAPTMVDFEAGQQMTSIGGSVTYDSTTGEVVFYVNHFSAFGVGVGVAPTPVTVAPVITPTPVKSTPAPAPTAAATGSGGGGGGCSLMRSDPSIFDPTLWMLVLISGILLWRKEKNIEGNDA